MCAAIGAPVKPEYEPVNVKVVPSKVAVTVPVPVGKGAGSAGNSFADESVPSKLGFAGAVLQAVSASPKANPNPTNAFPIRTFV